MIYSKSSSLIREIQVFELADIVSVFLELYQDFHQQKLYISYSAKLDLLLFLLYIHKLPPKSRTHIILQLPYTNFLLMIYSFRKNFVLSVFKSQYVHST